MVGARKSRFVYLNKTTDVQRSMGVKAVHLIVKDTFNYNSRGSSMRVWGVRVCVCGFGWGWGEMVVAD